MFASFYYIDSEYIKFLQNKEIENRGFTCVPNVDYANKTKFTYGVVMEINSDNGLKIPYFVPITSYDKKQEDNILIKVKKGGALHTVGSLRFNYMFPVPAIKKCILELDFKIIFILPPYFRSPASVTSPKLYCVKYSVGFSVRMPARYSK